jgi:hypothetical protein
MPRRSLTPFVALLALVALPATALAHDEENLLLPAPLAPAAAEEPGEHSDNLTYVKNIPYEARNGTTPNRGSDIEFAKIRGKQYALAGSYNNGLQIVDISKPDKAQTVGIYDCGVTQGDVQVFRQADEPGRVFVTYTSDTTGVVDSTCYQEAKALGYEVEKSNGRAKNGTFIADITDVRNPKTVSFAEVAQGSHNQTVHPSGDYMYNSNSDLITSFMPAIEVFDIRDPANPVQITEIPLPTRPGLGTESHDITFNEEGSRAYSAALSQGVIINTENPAEPKLITSFLDPTINLWHQSDPVTVGDREFLLVEDEFIGAIGTGQCPNGGMHVYDITGDNELDPVKVGYWNIDEVRTTNKATDSCTAHVFDIHEDEQIMTIAFYNGGVRVVDLGGLEGITLGDTSVTGEGLKEIAFFRTSNANSWAAKTPFIEKDGDFFLYGNDRNRGLDIYRFEAEGEQSKRKGRWMNAEEAKSLPQRPAGFNASPLDLLEHGA